LAPENAKLWLDAKEAELRRRTEGNGARPPTSPLTALHDLVQRYGGYHRVPADAWAQFDQDIADWQARRIRRLKWA
jgi:hypothetical protein